MKKTKLGILAITTLATTSFAFAQNSGPDGMPPLQAEGGVQGEVRMQKKPGFLQSIFGGGHEERKEIRQEFRGDMKDAKEEFKGDMKERHDYMMASTTATGTMPTPWKNMRENMKEARGEFKDGMQNMREDMRGKMASLTDAQLISISTKLGITLDSLKIKLASGTPLRAIIGNKITKEEMQQIIPMPMMASGTATSTPPMRKDRSGQGFFNSFRDRFFGKESGKEMINNSDMGMDGNLQIDAGMQAEIQKPSIRDFFKKLFNF